MRLRLWTAVLLLSALSALAGEARIIKVLPQLVDKRGRNALTPSLFDRDAYQLHLRQNPSEISALRFEIQYKAKGIEGPVLLRLEVRGSKNTVGTRYVFETEVPTGGYFAKWGQVPIDRETSDKIGSVVAWRASLVKDGTVLGYQESLLW